MSVQFYQDVNGLHRWCVVDEDDADANLHTSQGFSRRIEAAQNLFTNHAMMGIFVSAAARGEPEIGSEASGLAFQERDDGIFWIIRHYDTLIGMSYCGYADKFSAMNDLIILYTTLSVFVAALAQKRTAKA